jgi:regulator of sigma E protease
MLIVGYARPVEVGPRAFASLERLEPRLLQLVPQQVARIGRAPRYETGVRSADLDVRRVEPGTPAAEIGLRVGDVLVALDGAPLDSFELFEQALEERPEVEHRLVWRAGGGAERQAQFRLRAQTRVDEYETESIGYAFGADGGRATRPVEAVLLERSLPAAVGLAIDRSFDATRLIARVLWRTLVGALPASSLGGPILLYRVAGVAAQKGLSQFVHMAALVSINLALLNLFPLPLLDGGQAALVLLEAVRRRPLSPRFTERAALVGLLAILAVVLYASRNDLLRRWAP